MQRAILHMDLDTFFVSVERLLDSSLNNKPVLLGGSSNRGVIASCSYEARAFGVHAGMPMLQAKKLCPNGNIVKPSMGNYTKYSKMVADIVKHKVPIFEKSSIDEFYADLTGMDRFFGCYKYATELRETIIKESGLPISFGLSNNKTVSKIATGEAKPNNQIKVDYGQEIAFLAPLSIKKIPMVGAKTFQKLNGLGFEKIENIQQSTVETMTRILGNYGNIVWEKANGIDPSIVKPFRERKSISTERTFENDTNNKQNLETLIKSMAESLAFQLRKKDKLCSCVAVKIRYSDFSTYNKQIKTPYTSSDHVIMPHLIQLFEQLFNTARPVRLIGIKLSDLVSENYQTNLFSESAEKTQLYKALDNIRTQFGDRSIYRASTISKKPYKNHPNPFNKTEEED